MVRVAEPVARRAPAARRCRRERTALVGVEGDRVGALDPREQPASLLAQPERPAVRGVDVEPQAVPVHDVGDRCHRVDGAGVGGAGRGHHQERLQAGLAVGLDQPAERVGVHAEPVVGGHQPDPRQRDAGQVARLGARGMRLRGDVHDAAAEVVAEVGLAGRHHRREVGHRPTAGENAAGGVRVVEQVAQPAHHRGLDLRGHRRHPGHRDVAVERRGQELRHGGGVEATTRDVGEEARTRGVDGLLRHQPHRREHLVERRAGTRAAAPAPGRPPPRRPRRRPWARWRAPRGTPRPCRRRRPAARRAGPGSAPAATHCSVRRRSRTHSADRRRHTRSVAAADRKLSR